MELDTRFSRNRPFVVYVSVLLFAIFTLTSTRLHAFQPSAEQIAAFKNLPASEQKRLAAQYGIDVPSAAGAEVSGPTAQQAVSIFSNKMASKNQPSVEQVHDLADSPAKLKPFGYDLFSGMPTTFTPVHDVPVSSDYVLGPGDSLKVNLYGKESSAFELPVDVEGKVYLPDLGPLSVAGLSFAEAKQKLIDTIDQKMIGVKASIAMGQLRAIRVFVLGEASTPGSYVVSSLSTMTNALFLSGGVALTGSLRDIQLKRKGEVVQRLDLYDLLLKGDTRNDAQLRSGDVVFIPTLKQSAAVKGEVKRPAIYELKGQETASDLVSLAGGFTAAAYPELSQVERYAEGDNKLVVDLNLADSGEVFTIKDGDVLDIPATLKRKDGLVVLSGHVMRGGEQSWKPGMRVSDLVQRVEELKEKPDLNYALIKRYPQPQRNLQVISFSPTQALNNPRSDFDPVLQSRDEVLFFGRFEGSREEVMQNIVATLRAQASIAEPAKEVAVSGNVRYPGNYPLVKGMTVEQLIYAAGGLTEKAFQLRAELSRTEFGEDQIRQQSRFDLNLTDAKALQHTLKSRDVLQIKTIPEWVELQHVTLSGEVRFPGMYPIHKKDTLADVIERAGGLTEHAYVPGAVFTRVELKRQQAARLQEMRERLKDDITKAELAISNQSGGGTKGGAEIAEAQKLLDQLSKTSATGRLVIDLKKVIAKSEEYEIPLLDGDELFIPMRKNSVTIVGEVQLPISQIYESALDYRDYIERSGGTTDKADEGRIYIVKADGSVEIPDSSSWFLAEAGQVEPGDTIVVPLDADKIDQVVLWRDLSQIFYQIALGAAAVGSL